MVGGSRLSKAWDDLRAVVADIRYVIRPYLLRRHELLSPLFKSTTPVTAEYVDHFVQAAAPSEFGPLWQNYNRGFRLPEVEFWREN